MRILCGACAVLLLGVSGCTETNPAFCDPAVQACPTGGGPGDEGADLRAPTGEDLLTANPGDLRGGAPDLHMACGEGADCASKVCLPDGSCATDVIYANNRGGTCTGDHAGTMADPLCGTGPALDLSRKSGRRHVYLFGSAAAYEGLQLDNLTMSFTGPGGYAPTTARIEARGTAPAVRIRGGAVLLDGLELVGAGVEVVSCQSSAGAAAQVELLRSRAHDGQSSGIYGQGCKLAVRRSAVYSNGNRGVNSESNGDVLVENSYILGNRGGGVRMSSGSGSVRFSTLVYNGVLGMLGGVECVDGGAQKLVEASVVVRNGRPAGGSSLSDGCRLQRSALDEDSFGNGAENRYKANPDFVGLQDFHLKRTANSTACCIDQLASGPGVSDVLVDFDGTARPQGARWDLGAHEVR